MMQQARELLRHWRMGLSVLVVSSVVGLGSRSCKSVDVKAEITAGEILNAVVTVVLALLVADYLNKRAVSLRVEKDILIKDCADVLSAISVVRDFVRKTRSAPGTPAERREVLSLIDASFNALATLETDLGLCHKSLRDLNVMPVMTAMFRYKATLTGGVFPQRPLDERTYAKSERDYAECSKALAALRFVLNRR